MSHPERSPMLSLHPHASDPAPPALALRASARLDAAGSCQALFYLQGDLTILRLPAPAPPGPADGLWRHTCFEVFVGAAAGAPYHEFNASPSGQWAAYAFRAYRERATERDPREPPRLRVRRGARSLALRLRIPRSALPAGADAADRAWRIGLTAVLEAADGTLSYWALRHPDARPDFHQSAGFTLRIPAAPDGPRTSSPTTD